MVVKHFIDRQVTSAMIVYVRNLLIATGNPGKINELTQLLADIPLGIKTLADFPTITEVEETGATFEDNAVLKAKYFAEKTSLPTLADDSGLEVDALDGRPGVYSARYAPTPEKRIAKILQELKDTSDDQRTARFIAVVAFYNPQTQSLITATGTVKGVITSKPRAVGKRGFGYDPIFYSPELGKTFAEATSEEKNHVSHRARAIAKIKLSLKKTISQEE